ncbi:MAG: flagellar assembly protein FliW [Firmicutes bacterium HGW-Firmicutes-16]|nr:MAG: flagellar assembly protein FliW [Firmicutes bacterium HGW-Firmicutes-16]
MIIKTRDFGEVDISEKDVYHFTQPLFGFEPYTDFVILNDKDIGENIIWLQSVQEQSLCFILVDPSGMSATFLPELPTDSEKLLGKGDCLCWAVAVVPQDFKDSSVNLKSPVFINPETHLAAQIMLENDYPVRFFFLKEGNDRC